MNNHRPSERIATMVALVLVTIFSTVQFSQAQKAPSIKVSDLKGSWTATLTGVNGCGTAALLINFTLDATGNGTQTTTVNHQAPTPCGDSTTSGLPVQIQAFNPNGSGFIAFGCGTGCGYGFYIQVSRDKQEFNLAPQSVVGNFLGGVAIRQ
jgi:hypothetical protein